MRRVVTSVLAAVVAAVVAAVSLTAGQPPPLRVLLIGNSLTDANGMPAMIERLGALNGAPVVARAVAAPNFALEDHWNGGNARREVRTGGWSVVVLQQGPSALPESRVSLRRFTRTFADEIRKAGGRTALYMVWPSKARFGDFDRVSESYRLAAADVQGLLLPAGDAWREAWKRDPEMPLYAADDFHPSPLGSYLTALVIFQGLTHHAVATHAPVNGRGLDVLRLKILDAAARAVSTPTPLPGVPHAPSRSDGISDLRADRLDERTGETAGSAR